MAAPAPKLPDIKWRFNGSSKSTDVIKGVDMSGKTVAITGTTSGIGIETARALALSGAHVVMFVRNYAVGEMCKQKILLEKPDARIDIIQCDLTELSSVKLAAEKFISKRWPLHVLILNAGIVGVQQPDRTVDGYERTFAVNHLAQFHLCTLLLPVLKATQPARLVVVSSESHRKDLVLFGPGIDNAVTSADSITPELFTEPLGLGLMNYMAHYGKSKMCNVWFANAFERKYGSEGLHAVSLHPGLFINTGIAKDWESKLATFLAKPFTKSLEQGAATSVFCAVAPEMEGVGGCYLLDCHAVQPHALAHNVACQDKLWTISEQLVLEK